MNKNIFSQLKSIEDGMNSLLGAMSTLTHSKYTFQDNYDDVWSPNCDVYITSSTLHIVVELAGIKRDSIQLSLNDNYLIIKGNRDFNLPCSDVCFYHMEIETGVFERTIYLPDVEIDKETPQVILEEGMLKILFSLVEGKEEIVNIE